MGLTQKIAGLTQNVAGLTQTIKRQSNQRKPREMRSSVIFAWWVFFMATDAVCQPPGIATKNRFPDSRDLSIQVHQYDVIDQIFKRGSQAHDAAAREGFHEHSGAAQDWRATIEPEVQARSFRPGNERGFSVEPMRR